MRLSTALLCLPYLSDQREALASGHSRWIMPGNMAPSRSTGRSAGWRPGVHRPWLTRLIAFFATKNVTVPYLPQSSRGVAFGGARSYHLCGLGGLVLGLITGLLGARAIALTTEAVESVVIHHLVHQLAALKCEDPEAATVIGGIVADEGASRSFGRETQRAPAIRPVAETNHPRRDGKRDRARDAIVNVSGGRLYS